MLMGEVINAAAKRDVVVVVVGFLPAALPSNNDRSVVSETKNDLLPLGMSLACSH